MVNIGSTMSLLVHVVMTDPPEQNLMVLWKDAEATYDELGIPKTKRFGSMRMSMFSQAGESSRSIELWRHMLTWNLYRIMRKAIIHLYRKQFYRATSHMFHHYI